MPLGELRTVMWTYTVDVLDIQKTQLATVYGATPTEAISRAARTEISLLRNTPSTVAELINSLSKEELKSVLSLLNKEVLEDIYKEEKI